MTAYGKMLGSSGSKLKVLENILGSFCKKDMSFILFFISFMDLFAVSLTVPLLSTHIKALGASHVLVGLASSVYAILQFFCGPIAGSWSDIKGRQPILLLSLISCSLCYFSLGFASHMLLIIFIRVVLGTLKHTQSLCRAILSDVVPTEAQTRVFGQYNAVSGLGFIIGPVIGGHLAELNHGFYYVCCLTSFIFVINFCIALLFLPKAKNNGDNSRERRVKTFTGSIMMAVSHLRYMNWSLYWDSFSLKLMLAFSLAMIFSNYSLSLQEKFNITPSVVGYTISFQGILGAISGFSVGTVSRKYSQGPAKLTQHGFIALAISFFMIALSSSLWFFILALVPLAIVSSILRTALSQWSLERAPADERGSVLGAQHSLSAVSRMTAPAFAGIAQSAFGPDGPCYVSLFASIVGFIVASKISDRRKEKHKWTSPETSKCDD